MQGDVSAMDETKVFENETDAGQVDASNVQLSIRKNENLDINRERVGQDVRNEMNDQNDFKEAGDTDGTNFLQVSYDTQKKRGALITFSKSDKSRLISILTESGIYMRNITNY